MELIKNTLWENYDDKPLSVSVITPVFNRRDLLPRTLESVYCQTTRDFEYIIVNDGSTQYIDDIVTKFMGKADFPVLYIKKENGGVHTARNAGICAARGQMIALMDSDDEFTDDALEVLINIWNSIPGDHDEYLGIRTPVINEKGVVQGELFPDAINELPREESYAIFQRINAGVEHYGFRRADIMKANPWPEPENITFVTERILWGVLEKDYKYFYTNYVPRIYHTENEDSYIRRKKHSMQTIKNKHWNSSFILNRPQIYKDSIKNRLVMNLQVCCFSRIIRESGQNPPGEKLLFWGDRLLQLLMYLPGMIVAHLYKKQRMEITVNANV